MIKIYEKKHRRPVLYPLLPIFAAAAIAFLLISFVEKRIFPTADEVCSKYTTTYINKKTDEIIKNIMTEKSLSYTDFYSATGSSITVNSVLINEVCSKIAADLSQALNNTPQTKVTLPLGSVTGMRIFSGAGPKISVKIYPIGDAAADFQTEVTDLGINNINYRIFINITANVSTVNPLGKNRLTINRRCLLVDTIISGSVPNSYWQTAPFNQAGNK